jgi:GT2 family glycosyltransferase
MIDFVTEQIAQTATAGLPTTSLVIASRNRPQMLVETVESVLQGDEVPSEIVVIDQSAEPNARLANLQTARDCEVRYQQQHATGLSRARNAGVRAAQHEVLIFIDDDVLVTREWFGTIVRALLNVGPHSVITGQVRPTNEKPGGFAPSTIVVTTPAVYEGRIGQDVLFPLNMAMYRSAINEVGEFDERLGTGSRFPSSEDNDFGFRLLEAGYRIIYAPEVIVYHRAWRSDRDYFPLRWDYGVGQGAFYAKHLNLTDRYMLRRMLRALGHYAAMCYRRMRVDRRRAIGDGVYVVGILSGAMGWLLTQRRTQ